MEHTPYIYQTLHVEGRRVRLLNAHLELLQRGAEESFGIKKAIDFSSVQSDVTELLDGLYYPKDRSSYVRLMVDCNGGVALHAEPNSLYCGYVLRAIRPEAKLLKFESPFNTIQNSAMLATWELASAGLAGATPLRLNCRGEIVEAECGAPLFALYGKVLFTSIEPRGVEGRLAVEAISRAGLKLSVEPVTEEHISILDELFYVDYRGVTSISRCNGHLLMSGCALRVANYMEKIVSKV